MRIYRIDRFPGVRGMGDVFLLGILYTMFLKKGTDKTRNDTKDTTLTCMKIGKGSDRGLLLYLICLMTGADKTRNDTKDTTITYIYKNRKRKGSEFTNINTTVLLPTSTINRVCAWEARKWELVPRPGTGLTPCSGKILE